MESDLFSCIHSYKIRQHIGIESGMHIKEAEKRNPKVTKGELRKRVRKGFLETVTTKCLKRRNEVEKKTFSKKEHSNKKD